MSSSRYLILPLLNKEDLVNCRKQVEMYGVGRLRPGDIEGVGSCALRQLDQVSSERVRPRR